MLLLLVTPCLLFTISLADLFVTNGTHVLRINETTEHVSVIVDAKDLSGSNTTTGSIPSSGSEICGLIVGLTADIAANRLFWSIVCDSHSFIYKSFMDGSMSEAILSGTGRIESVSLDWVSRHLYWTDSKTGTVEMSHYDGTGRRLVVFLGVQRPCTLVVDPIFGFVFWMDCGLRRLERIRLDGSHRLVMVASGIGRPAQLSISYSTRRIYWTEASTRLIVSADMHGNDVTTARDLSHRAVSIHALVVIGNHAYVSNGASTVMATRVDAAGDEEIEEIVSGLGDGGPLYTLLSDDYNLQPQSYHPCMDAGNGGCSDICLPTQGIKYVCACPTFGGRAITSDSHTCQVPGDILVYSLQEDGVMGFLSVDPGAPHHDRTLIGSSSSPAAVTLDKQNLVVYWSDLTERRIYRAPLNGSGQTVLLESGDGINAVHGLAVDWEKGRLYFTNFDETTTSDHTPSKYTSHSIEMISLDGLHRKTITTDVTNPRALTLDLKNKYLYYTDCAKQGRIVRAWLDGSHRQTILEEDLSNPTGLAFFGHHLYVVNPTNDQKRDKSTILVFDTVTGSWEFMLAGQLQSAVDVAVRGDTVYYTEKGGVRDKSLISVYEAMSQKQVLLEAHGSISIEYARLDDSLSDGEGACGLSPCHEALCIDTPQPPNYRCVCPDGVPLFTSTLNASFCEPSKNYVLFADLTRIKMVSLDLHTMPHSTHTLVHGAAGSDFVALAYNNFTTTVYWSDRTSRSIQSLKIDDATQEVVTVFKGNYSVDGITVQSSGRLFWTGRNESMEFIARYIPAKGAHSYRVIVTDLDSPRAIISHEQKRLIFWTEYGLSHGIPCLKRAKTNGRQVTTLLHKDLYWPNSLALQGLILYVSDGFYRRIFSMTLDGSMRKELVFLSGSMDHMFGLAVHQHLLFFTDWHSNSTIMVDTVTGRHLTLADHLYRPTAIVVHHPQPFLESVYCAKNECDDHCIPTPYGHYCTCHVGRELDRDGKKCVNAAGGLWEIREKFRCGVACSRFAECARLIPTTHHQCVCNPGYHGNGNICTPCTEDTYKPGLSNDSCTTCPHDMTTLSQRAALVCVCSDRQAVEVNGSCIVSATHSERKHPHNLPTHTAHMSSVHPHRTRPVGDGISVTPGYGSRIIPPSRLPTQCPPQLDHCPDGERLIMVLPPGTRQVFLPVTWRAHRCDGQWLNVSSNYPIINNSVKLPWLPRDVRHSLNFHAVDHLDKVAWCNFTVFVKDVEVPRFTYCPSDIITHTRQLRQRVLWPHPKVRDNVRVERLSPSHSPGSVFPLGVRRVNYTAVDGAGNEARCNFTVTVRQEMPCELPNLNHGHFMCGVDPLHSHVCHIRCEPQYIRSPVVVGIDGGFSCLVADERSRAYKVTERHELCLKRHPIAKISQRFVLSFQGFCSHDNSDLRVQISASVTRYLVGTTPCRVTPCSFHNASLVCRGRSERAASVTGDDREVKRATVRSFTFLLQFNVSLNLSSGMTVHRAKTLLWNLKQELLRWSRDWSLMYAGQSYSIIAGSVQTGHIQMGCRFGYILLEKNCVECPSGSRHNTTLRACELCPLGTYQPRSGGRTCIDCTDGGQTVSTGARGTHQCVPRTGLSDTTKFIVITACSLGLLSLVIAFLLCCQYQRYRVKHRRHAPNSYPASPAHKTAAEMDSDALNNTQVALLKDENTPNGSLVHDGTLNNRPSQYINWREFNGQTQKIYVGLPESSKCDDVMECSTILSLPFSNNHPGKPITASNFRYDPASYSNTLSLPFSNKLKSSVNTIPPDLETLSKSNNQQIQLMGGSFDRLYKPLHKPTPAMSSFNIKHASNVGLCVPLHDTHQSVPISSTLSMLQTRMDDLGNGQEP